MERVTSRFEEMTSALGADLVSERAGQIVASPRSTDDVAALLRHADANGIGVEITGAGTKRGWAGRAGAEVLLETRGLAGVREHSWQDLTATVGAGTTWAEMQQVLARHGQQVALDPLWPDQATVGGVIATNDSGSLRLKYGSLRDLVIGMTIVLADGTVARSGGKVVKNVAGYDLHKLMIGAYGTLGVVAEVTFRLHAIPASTLVWTMESADAESIGRVMMKVLDSQLSVQAMQMRASAAGFALDVELAAMEQVMRSQVRVLDEFGTGVVVAAGDVFGARERLFRSDGVVAKVTMLATSIAKTSAEVVRLRGEAVTQATGILFARFDSADAEAAVSRLRELVAAEGEGSVTVVRGVDGLGARASVGSAAGVMAEIKRRFDPKGTLNPGVVIGA